MWERPSFFMGYVVFDVALGKGVRFREHMFKMKDATRFKRFIEREIVKKERIRALWEVHRARN